MELKYIDIHSHLNSEEFNLDREKVIEKLNKEGIYTITVGYDYESSLLAVELAQKYSNLFAAVGLHPNDVFTKKFDYQEFFNLAKNNKVVAIGECGLEYFFDSSDIMKEKQKEIFKEHIRLSLEVNKPLMIHARPQKNSMDAYRDVLDILEKYKKDNTSLMANFHFFSGNLEIVKRVISLGFTISFDGPITFSNNYDKIIKNIPITSIMVETDSPYAAPTPYRGERCEPWMVKEVVKTIARVKNIEEVEVLKVINKTTQKVFSAVQPPTEK